MAMAVLTSWWGVTAARATRLGSRSWQCRNFWNNQQLHHRQVLPMQRDGRVHTGGSESDVAFWTSSCRGDPLVVFFGDPTNPGNFSAGGHAPFSLPNNDVDYIQLAGDFNGDGLPEFLPDRATTGKSICCSAGLHAIRRPLQKISLGQTGTNTLSANYSGDSYTTSSTAPGVPAIEPLQTGVVLVALNSQEYVAGQGAIELRATVSQEANPVPAGLCEFKDGKFSLGSASVSNGVATLYTATLGPGSHSLTAVYGGALRSTQPYGPAVSAAVSVVVAAAPAFSKVDVTVPPCCFQPPAGYQVDVSGFGGGLPTGTLSVTDQGSGTNAVPPCR